MADLQKEALQKHLSRHFSPRLMSAFSNVSRVLFVRKEDLDHAWGDYPLSIGHGQTISQPTTVMIMLQALDIKPGHKVLEVGSGSGWNAALMGYLVGSKCQV